MNLPVIKEIKKFYIPDYQTIFLNNGISCHILNVPDSEVIKMEVVFDAGRFYEKKHGVAKTTASLLKEGTEKYSSKEIAENIDFYGASLSTSATMDISLLQLYTLEKYFDNIMPIVHDIITEPSFNESELEKYKRRNIENLKIELSKNEVLAYRHLTEKIYGDNHP
ncbi:MAG TPA: insulinase family protein, partial [Saprospiraceae bacterium]|nr:insulinase family protein [Saprospiraceae bacterium]